MLKVNGTTIQLTRGDTALIQLALYTDPEHTTAYVPTEGDSIRFAMKKRMTDSEAILLTKNIPTDTLILEIEPSDTYSMTYSSVTPYKYDVQLTYANGRVDTFITEADIFILPEVDAHE